MLKIIALLIWALVATSFFITFPYGLNKVFIGFGAVLFVAHIAEIFIFREKIQAKGDGLLISTVNTLLFGVVYIKP